MNNYLQNIKIASKKHKDLLVGFGVIGFLGVLVGGFTFLSAQTGVTYQPAKACDMITMDEAKALLGVKTLNSVNEKPTIEKDTAISRCGYTDGNEMQGQMKVAAVIVRSGVNDKGVEQNKTQFMAGKPKDQGIETVEGVGDAAYYNAKIGQLNVLNGRDWLILSYGLGSDPLSNTLDDAKKLAQVVLE